MRHWPEHRWVHRLFFLGLNTGLCLAAVTFVALPARNYLAVRDAEIAEQRALLARFNELAKQEAVVAEEGELPADSGEYLSGANEGVVNADLQTRLKGLIETGGARLRAVRTLPPQTAEHIKYVGSSVEIFGSLASIARAVGAIETAKPFLFVQGAVIRPAPPSGRADIAQEPVIDAQLEVFGALVNPPKSQ
jgi:general secretion pathway protein M